MAGQNNVLPTFNTALEVHGKTSKDWYFFWQGLFTGLSPGNETAVTLGASPYTYNALVRGFLIVSGGTVTMIEFSRDGITYYNTGQTAGTFPLNARDRLRITYAVVPTVTFVPT